MIQKFMLATARWIRFSCDLVYIVLGRLGSIGAAMIVVPVVVMEAMAWSGVDDNQMNDFQSRLIALQSAILLLGLVVCCIGLTLQSVRRGEVKKAFGAAWWRRPRN